MNFGSASLMQEIGPMSLVYCLSYNGSCMAPIGMRPIEGETSLKISIFHEEKNTQILT